MRKWVPVALIGLAILWFIATNVGSSMALADLAGRPVLAVTRSDGTRFAVQPQGTTPHTITARLQWGEGVMFGYRFRFALPDGTTATCTQRFRMLTCDGGWQAERAP